MKKPIENINVRERFLGVFILVIVQSLVGLIHIFLGSVMILGTSVAPYSTSSLIYSYYTLAFGLLTLFFTILLWAGKRLGWIGTVAIFLFVTIADTIAFFSLFNVLGIPKIAGLGEIPYSLIILCYLLQSHIKLKYAI